jgi:hypothetical protein
MGMNPVAWRGASGGEATIKEMTSLELKELAYRVLSKVANTVGIGSLAFNGNTSWANAGAYTDSYRNDVDTGTSNGDIVSTQYILRQNLVTGDLPESAPPNFYYTANTTVPLIESDTAVYETLANNILYYCTVDEGPNSYRISATSPAATYGGTWESVATMVDQYNLSGSATYYMWKRVDDGGYTTQRPLKPGSVAGTLNQFTDTEIINIARVVRERIVATGLAQYHLGPVAPVGGTWTAVGTYVDKVADLTAAYLSTYILDSTYTTDYLGPVDYLTDYTGDYFGSQTFNSTYSGPQNYAGPATYLGPQNYYGPQTYDGPATYLGPQNYYGPQTFSSTYLGPQTFVGNYLGPADYISTYYGDQVVPTTFTLYSTFLGNPFFEYWGDTDTLMFYGDVYNGTTGPYLGPVNYIATATFTNVDANAFTINPTYLGPVNYIATATFTNVDANAFTINPTYLGPASFAGSTVYTGPGAYVGTGPSYVGPKGTFASAPSYAGPTTFTGPATFTNPDATPFIGAISYLGPAAYVGDNSGTTYVANDGAPFIGAITYLGPAAYVGDDSGTTYVGNNGQPGFFNPNGNGFQSAYYGPYPYEGRTQYYGTTDYVGTVINPNVLPFSGVYTNEDVNSFTSSYIGDDSISYYSAFVNPNALAYTNENVNTFTNVDGQGFTNPNALAYTNENVNTFTNVDGQGFTNPDVNPFVSSFTNPDANLFTTNYAATYTNEDVSPFTTGYISSQGYVVADGVSTSLSPGIYSRPLDYIHALEGYYNGTGVIYTGDATADSISVQSTEYILMTYYLWRRVA